jgi:hypothetical protein
MQWNGRLFTAHYVLLYNAAKPSLTLNNNDNPETAQFLRSFRKFDRKSVIFSEPSGRR